VNRRNWIQAAAAAAASIGGSCSRPRPAPSRKIVVATLPHITLSSLYLAHESGYFSQAGLNVDLRQVGMAAEALPLLASGKIDASFVGLTPSLVNAVAKGAHLRIVAGREVATPCNETCTLYVSRKSFPAGLQSMAALKGKRVAILGLTMTQFCLDKFIEPAGISSKDLELRSLRAPDAVAAMLAHRIDAMVSSRFERDLDNFTAATFRVKSLAEILPNYQYSFILFGDWLLNADPSIGARFLAAYLRGAREFAQGKNPRFLFDYAAANRLDPQKVAQSCRATNTLDGAIDLRSIELFSDWAEKSGLVAQRVPAASMVDTRFLEQARKL
jgi:ABC-type nitrate/sulfonate/bicarbonate transport system substrate-binding protein